MAIYGEEKSYSNADETQLSFQDATVRELIMELLKYPMDVRVDIECDHYDGDFPRKALTVGTHPQGDAVAGNA